MHQPTSFSYAEWAPTGYRVRAAPDGDVARSRRLAYGGVGDPEIGWLGGVHVEPDPAARTITGWLPQFAHARLRLLVVLNVALVLETLAWLRLPRVTLDIDLQCGLPVKCDPEATSCVVSSAASVAPTRMRKATSGAGSGHSVTGAAASRYDAGKLPSRPKLHFPMPRAPGEAWRRYRLPPTQPQTHMAARLALVIIRAGSKDSLAWWEDESFMDSGRFVLDRLFPREPGRVALTKRSHI